jgi:hypothetical protein
VSSALVRSPTVRRAVLAATGVAGVAALGVGGIEVASAAGSATATPAATSGAGAASPAASVVVGTTRSTVHAAGSTVPGWGFVFLIALFVVAVAVALPATRRRTVGARS